VLSETELKRYWEEEVVGNLKHFPVILLEGLRKTTKYLSQDSRSPGRKLNHGPPEYEAGVLTTRPRRSVKCTHLHINNTKLNINPSVILNLMLAMVHTDERDLHFCIHLCSCVKDSLEYDKELYVSRFEVQTARRNNTITSCQCAVV
jgi:hypothetical protein